MNNTNYSYQTSLIPYFEVDQDQTQMIFGLIKDGLNCLLSLAEVSHLPQSTVAGRVNDLIKSGKVEYNDFIIYKNRKRKRIILTLQTN